MPDLPDPLVIACLSKLYNRALHGSPLVFLNGHSLLQELYKV